MTKLSIAIATFNGAPYLKHQLRSFLEQGRRPDELVICDDGSTDGTLAFLQSFAEQAPFEVRVVPNEERLGYNRNFAKAIELCTGDIIFISDQDDEWFPEKIEAVLRAFASHPTSLAVTNDQMIADAAGAPSGVTVLGNIRRLGFSDDMFGPGCCTAMRRQLLDIVAPFPGDVVPYDHWINIIPALLGVRVIEEAPLQTYRRHSSNTSGSVFADAGAGLRTLASAKHRSGQQKAFAGQLDMISAVEERLRSRREEIARLGLPAALEQAFASLAQQRSAYSARLSLFGQGRLRRTLSIARMLHKGTYRHFSGVRSAVKDLLS